MDCSRSHQLTTTYLPCPDGQQPEIQLPPGYDASEQQVSNLLSAVMNTVTTQLESMIEESAGPTQSWSNRLQYALLLYSNRKRCWSQWHRLVFRFQLYFINTRHFLHVLPLVYTRKLLGYVTPPSDAVALMAEHLCLTWHMREIASQLDSTFRADHAFPVGEV